MSFHDLPQQWPTLPLDDPDHVGDVLDIFVDLRARSVGSLLVLICDERRRPVQPVLIEQIDPTPPPDAAAMLEHIAVTIGQANPDATVLCAVARRDGLDVTIGDHAWRECIEQAFAERLQVLGVHLITVDGSMPIPDQGAAA